jgi:NDP-sugar pyrophosphorylase family protein
MNLQAELNELAKKIASFHEPPKVSDKVWQDFAANSVVALMAGGESSRYAAVLNGEKVNKNAHELPNGDTMIEMAIRSYRDAGLKKFVALVFHNAHSIEDRLGDGAKLGVEIKYSYDPEQPVGKGGAVRNALQNGSVPEDANLFVTNPDDLILGFPGSWVRYIGEAHLEGQKQGMLATAALAPGEAYHGTGVMVVDNRAVDTKMYPMIPIPLHTGMTVFSPKIYPRFYELFPLDQKNDFEQILFPLLAHEKKLWSAGITKGRHLAVNDLKSYKQLIEYLAENEA